jgi:lipoprotein-anchoring transpeptidase ErfK/SrfK
MRHALLAASAAGIFVLGIASPVTAGPVQNNGPCAQIRAACQNAGFAQGAARDGIGLQIHCIMPIMQATAQPSTARLPLPNVSSPLVAECKSANPHFGQPFIRRTQSSAQVPPEILQLPGTANRNVNSTFESGQQSQESSLRPPMAMGSEQQRSAIPALPPEDRPETGPAKPLPPQFRRAIIDYASKEPAGTIIVDTSHTYLYLVLDNGKAMRYGIGVGREGFTWSGSEKVTKMAEWPDWHPPEEMIERQPYLPRFMAGGEGNPLGARALYLGHTLYRIHGTNQPSTIGTFVSSGCIRLTNEDVTDLYTRVKVGTRVVVLTVPQADSVQAHTGARSLGSSSTPGSKAATAGKPVTASAPSAPLQGSPPRLPTTIGATTSRDTSDATSAPAAKTAPHADEWAE